MSTDGKVLAEWVGPSAVRIGGETIQPGDTFLIGASEAEESANWRPVDAKKPQPAKPEPEAAPAGGDEE